MIHENLYKALLRAELRGIIDPKKQICDRAWNGIKPSTKRVKMSQILNNKVQPSHELIRIWADVCKETLNFIYYGKDEEI